MEEKKIDNTKSKLYVLCSDILNPVYATVQGSHAVAQYCIDNSNLEVDERWNNDTVIFLYYPHHLLQRCIKDNIFIHPKLISHISVWQEPDLNNVCSAIAFWNYDMEVYDINDNYIVDIAQDVLDSLSVVSNKAFDNSAKYVTSIRKKKFDNGTIQIITICKGGEVFECIVDKPIEEFHTYEIKEIIELKHSVHFDEDSFYSKYNSQD